MPEFIPIFAAAAATAEAVTAAAAATITLSSVASTVGEVALVAGISYGISLLTRSSSATASPQSTVKQGLPARFIIFGRLKHAGVMFFYDVSPVGPNNPLCIGHILACHQIGKIEQHWLNDYPIGVRGGGLSGSVTGADAFGRALWDADIYIGAHLGAPGQAADSSMLTLWPTNVWSASSRLQGMAYAVAEYNSVTVQNNEFYNHYPSGAPEYKATIQGLLVYDPRDGAQSLDPTTWRYSDNAALIIAWYIQASDGWGLGTAAVDWNNIVAQATICDQIVPCPDGTTEKRWRIWGKYTLDEQRKTVLNDLLLACAGRVMAQPDGTVMLLVGQKITPTVTLTDDDIIALESFTDGPEATDRIDRVYPRIPFENANWQDFDCPPWLAPAAPAGPALPTNKLDLALRFCPSPYQAQRVAKKVADEKNAGWRGNIRTRLTGLMAIGQWTIALNLSEMPQLKNLWFEVTSIALNTATMDLTIGVRQMSQTAWDWDKSSGSAAVQIPAGWGGSGSPANPPTNVTVTAQGNHSLLVSWTNGSNTQTSQMQYRVAASPSSTAGWIEDDPAVGATSNITPILTAGTQYDVRVRGIAPYGLASGWVAVYATTA